MDETIKATDLELLAQTDFQESLTRQMERDAERELLRAADAVMTNAAGANFGGPILPEFKALAEAARLATEETRKPFITSSAASAIELADKAGVELAVVVDPDTGDTNFYLADVPVLIDRRLSLPAGAIAYRFAKPLPDLRSIPFEIRYHIPFDSPQMYRWSFYQNLVW